MITEKNAIGFPTESGGFEEIASDAPKASPDGLTAQDVTYGDETVDDALTELDSKINLKFGFPDYTRSLGNITTQNGSYKATEDCCAIGFMKKSENGQAIVYVDTYSFLSTSNDATMVNIFAPLRKGQTISTRSTYGVYYITIFALHES